MISRFLLIDLGVQRAVYLARSLSRPLWALASRRAFRMSGHSRAHFSMSVRNQPMTPFADVERFREGLFLAHELIDGRSRAIQERLDIAVAPVDGFWKCFGNVRLGHRTSST